MILRFDKLLCLRKDFRTKATGKGILKFFFFSLAYSINRPVMPTRLSFLLCFHTDPILPSSIRVSRRNSFWTIDHASDVECRPITGIIYSDHWWRCTPVQVPIASLVYWNALRLGLDNKYRARIIIACLQGTLVLAPSQPQCDNNRQEGCYSGGGLCNAPY